MKICLYCGQEKPDHEFSDEHIWPDALGGDYLPREVWRTTDVCQRCNSLCGLFVDGSFIRSWAGQAELSSGSLEYLAGKAKPAAVPLDYLGPIQNIPVPHGHIADYWVGPCGANIIHIRPDDGDEQWASYAGGNPKAKKAKAGRAYIALTSKDGFWILTSLLSFKRHFGRAERFVVNADLPSEWSFRKPDRSVAVQAEDMKTVDAIINHGRTGSQLQTQLTIAFDLGSRMLAKIGLAVGYKLLGPTFLDTEYAEDLRRGMREANVEKRKAIPVRGSSFLSSAGFGGAEQTLAWPGGWVLMLNVVEGELSFSVISPTGKSMMILVSNETSLVSAIEQAYNEGQVWVTVPAAEQAVGPVSLPQYLTHQLRSNEFPALTALAAKRADRAELPPCQPTNEQSE